MRLTQHITISLGGIKLYLYSNLALALGIPLQPIFYECSLLQYAFSLKLVRQETHVNHTFRLKIMLIMRQLESNTILSNKVGLIESVIS